MKEIVYDVVDRKSGKKFQCVPQMVDLNFDGRYCMRYNIGIEGYAEWSFVEAIYDNDEFNKRYEVVGSHESIMTSR